MSLDSHGLKHIFLILLNLFKLDLVQLFKYHNVVLDNPSLAFHYFERFGALGILVIKLVVNLAVILPVLTQVTDLQAKLEYRALEVFGRISANYA